MLNWLSTTPWRRMGEGMYRSASLVGGEWLSWRPRCCTLEESATGSHWIGGWMAWWGESSCPYQDSNSNLFSLHPVASRCTDCAIPEPIIVLFVQVVFLEKSSIRPRIQGALRFWKVRETSRGVCVLACDLHVFLATRILIVCVKCSSGSSLYVSHKLVYSN
jgi:hypothetical protein